MPYNFVNVLHNLNNHPQQNNGVIVAFQVPAAGAAAAAGAAVAARGAAGAVADPLATSAANSRPEATTKPPPNHLE